LQEQILAQGGDRWDRLAREAPDDLVERGRIRLLAALDAEAAPPHPLQIPWHRRPVPVALATAASLLLAVVAFERSRPPAPSAPTWGWARPGALPSDLSRSAYLARLADDAAQWFRRRPDNPQALALRLNEFRQGCSTLILAEHRPLPDEDRTWLVGKCREWAVKVEAHLRAVEAGAAPTAVLIQEADATVNALIAALRARARIT